jgi:ribosomal protein L2
MTAQHGKKNVQRKNRMGQFSLSWNISRQKVQTIMYDKYASIVVNFVEERKSTSSAITILHLPTHFTLFLMGLRIHWEKKFTNCTIYW